MTHVSLFAHLVMQPQVAKAAVGAPVQQCFSEKWTPAAVLLFVIVYFFYIYICIYCLFHLLVWFIALLFITFYYFSSLFETEVTKHTSTMDDLEHVLFCGEGSSRSSHEAGPMHPAFGITQVNGKDTLEINGNHTLVTNMPCPFWNLCFSNSLDMLLGFWTANILHQKQRIESFFLYGSIYYK